MSAKNKEVVARVNAAFAANDTEGFLACCVDDVSWTMVGDETITGKDNIRKWMASMGPGAPPQFSVDYVIAEGDIAAAHGDMTMKDINGKPESYSYCDLYRFRGDKLAELRAFVIKTSAA